MFIYLIDVCIKIHTYVSFILVFPSKPYNLAENLSRNDSDIFDMFF